MEIQKLEKSKLYSYIVIHIRNLVRQVHTSNINNNSIHSCNQAKSWTLKGQENPTYMSIGLDPAYNHNLRKGIIIT